jgi:hypothetical protein
LDAAFAVLRRRMIPQEKQLDVLAEQNSIVGGTHFR